MAESDGQLVAYQRAINLQSSARDEDGYHSEAEAVTKSAVSGCDL